MVGQVTSTKAYDMIKADPEHTFIVDIRSRAEYFFVGHPPTAYNIPYRFWSASTDEKSGYQDNPHFVSDMTEKFDKTDTIIVMCRSGKRSPLACRYLEEAGFIRILDMTDGFEGDKITDKTNPQYGHRCINGWKKNNLPWGYEIKKEFIYAKSS